MTLDSVSKGRVEFYSDPVCGFPVPASSEFHSHYLGIDFFFCCDTCQLWFEGFPESFVAPDGSLREMFRLLPSSALCEN